MSTLDEELEESIRLNEFVGRLLGIGHFDGGKNPNGWRPTIFPAQAWLVAEKLGISVVRLPEGKGWMAGKFDEEMDFFDTEIGWVDGCMDHCAVAPTMPLAVCRAAEKK